MPEKTISIRRRSVSDWFLASLPFLLLLAVAAFAIRHFVDPAPPNAIILSTGSSEGGYEEYAKLYAEILKDDHVHVVIRPSDGARENYDRLRDEHSDVDAGFVQDGIGNPEEAPNLVSLGSIAYEPLWIFHRLPKDASRLAQLSGKRIAVGKPGGGTELLAKALLKASHVDPKNAVFVPKGWEEARDALLSGSIDAAIFLGTGEDPLIRSLILDPTVRLMSLDQAEAITRQIPYLHHLVLPHGAIDLAANRPDRDIDLVSPTATLLIKDRMHPSIIYLLLRTISQVHDDPGLFEKKNEFPTNTDFQFPLAEEAKTFYKSGPPFWQRFLPYWLAALLDRYILVLIPFFAVAFPLLKLLPKIYHWRIRSRILKSYEELKLLEMLAESSLSESGVRKYQRDLDEIEDRVNHLKLPLSYIDHLYSLRGHIDFVRGRISRTHIPS